MGGREHELQDQLSHAQKRIQTFNRKKTVMSSTGSTRQKIIHSQKEDETKESIVCIQKARKIKDDDIKKAGKDQNGQIPQQRKNLGEASETVWCEEKMLSARRGTRSLGMGEKSDDH